MIDPAATEGRKTESRHEDGRSEWRTRYSYVRIVKRIHTYVIDINIRSRPSSPVMYLTSALCVAMVDPSALAFFPTTIVVQAEARKGPPPRPHTHDQIMAKHDADFTKE